MTTVFAARATIAAAAVSLVALIALHILKPELHPSRTMISRYALGPYGWIMALCFAAFGMLGCQVLVRGSEILTAQAGPVQKLEEFSYVRQQSRRRARPPGLLSCDVERR